MPLKILHEDATLLVVDKPAGLTVEEIARQLGYTPAHRLDKDTSGVLLVAKNEESLESLRRRFKEREVEKHYICLVEGDLKEDQGIIHTLLTRSPADRRKQQIRAHMVQLGHPIAGDKLYGFKNQHIPRGLTRQFLHAGYLKIASQEFVSELPEDLQNVLELLPSHYGN